MVLLYNLHSQQISHTCKITLLLLCEKFLQRNICSFALRTEQYQQMHLYASDRQDNSKLTRRKKQKINIEVTNILF